MHNNHVALIYSAHMFCGLSILKTKEEIVVDECVHLLGNIYIVKLHVYARLFLCIGDEETAHVQVALNNIHALSSQNLLLV